jgi:arylsulfatase
MNPSRHFSSIAVPALLLIACLIFSGCGDSRVEGDLILITVDTLRADHLGSYGNADAETPSLDAIAAHGLQFDRAFTPFPRTTPGLASLMTGQVPAHHGSREVSQPMSEGVVTLAERLKAAGFVTLGITANGAAGKGQGFAKGFDQLEVPDEGQRMAVTLTKQALELVDQQAAGKQRLFLWVHYVDPHYPYGHPGPENPAGEACRDLFKFSSQGRWFAGQVFYDQGGIASRALESCTALYNDTIAFTDHSVGELLEGLGRRRDLKAGLVVVTADHGENLGEQGLFYQHGSSLHDASSRVPLLVAGPGIEPGVDDDLIGLEDLAPTLLHLLGVEARDDAVFDGSDQSSRLRRGWLDGWRDPSPEVLGSESGSALVAAAFEFISSGYAGGLHCTNTERYSLCREPNGPDRLYDHQADPSLEHDLAAELPDVVRRHQLLRERWPVEFPRRRAVRDKSFKLEEIPRLRGGYRRVLYDLRQDPAESRDVADDHPEVVRRLGHHLDRWIAQLPESPRTEVRDEESLDELRALGYID